MANYEEARDKLTNTQSNKLKSATTKKTVTTLRATKKIFQEKELPHVFFLTTKN